MVGAGWMRVCAWEVLSGFWGWDDTSVMICLAGRSTRMDDCGLDVDVDLDVRVRVRVGGIIDGA